MITNLPTPEDFFQSGRELLNFAWETTSDLLVEFDQADYYGFNQDEVSDKYWASAKRSLTTSLALVQQGVEFLLKGKISAISPYLLIGDVPSRWPSASDGYAIDFGQFRTVDAQDLIKIHDTFSASPLRPEFSAKFHSLRETRNQIMHTAAKSVTVRVTDVLEAILFMHKELFPSLNWPTLRLEFLESAPSTELGDDFATNRVSWETSTVVDVLQPAQVQTYFGFDKKQRRYLCPRCLYAANTDAGFEFKLAVLRPKSAASTSVYCAVCNATHEVVRQDCENDGCLGNVIGADTGSCLTCGR